jgi:hypothetical protein
MMPVEATTEQTIRCPRCSAMDNIVTLQTFANGTQHRRCCCARCGAFLRFIPQPLEQGQKPVLYFGKHQGTPLTEIPTDYLEWVTNNVRLSGRKRREVQEELDRRQQTEVPAHA